MQKDLLCGTYLLTHYKRDRIMYIGISRGQALVTLALNADARCLTTWEVVKLSKLMVSFLGQMTTLHCVVL